MLAMVREESPVRCLCLSEGDAGAEEVEWRVGGRDRDEDEGGKAQQRKETQEMDVCFARSCSCMLLRCGGYLVERDRDRAKRRWRGE